MTLTPRSRSMKFGGDAMIRTTRFWLAILALLLVLVLLLRYYPWRAGQPRLDYAIPETRERLNRLRRFALVDDLPVPSSDTGKVLMALHAPLQNKELFFSPEELSTSRVLDAWDQPIRLRYLRVKGARFFFVSNGPNAKFDGGEGDDITCGWPESHESAACEFETTP